MGNTVPTDPLVFIREGVEDITAYLEILQGGEPQAARVARIQAVDRIDVTIRRLLRLRDQLTEERPQTGSWADTGSQAGWERHDDPEQQP